MKKLILVFLIPLLFMECDENDEQPKDSIDGKWVINIVTHEPNLWLRDLSLAKWHSLEINLDLNGSNTINFSSKNSYDTNIFPESSIWTLGIASNENGEYTGLVDGLGTDGSNKRIYYISLDEDNLVIYTLVQPDCPEDEDCTLEICCDVQFKFTRKSE
jgi:hypothetical protein